MASVILKTVVLNPKGGSGKTTIATNLAAWYAANGHLPVLKDLDAQASSTRWLAKRAESMPRIHGISPFNVPANVTRTFAMRIPPDADRMVIDTPAAVSKQQLSEFTHDAHRIIVPVLPSDIDIQAVTRSIADLLLHGKVQRGDNRIAVVANRVKRNTTIFKSLMRFLDSLKIPVVAVLRDSQNYIKAAELGIGIHEMKGARVRVDQAHWATLVDWIEHGTVPAPETAWLDAPNSRDSKDAESEDAANDPTAPTGETPVVRVAVAAASAPSAPTASPQGEDSPKKPALRLFNISAFIRRKS